MVMMTARQADIYETAQTPDLGDVFSRQHGGVLECWRVTGIMVQGTQTYLLLARIDAPTTLIVAALSEFGNDGPFEKTHLH